VNENCGELAFQMVKWKKSDSSVYAIPYLNSLAQTMAMAVVDTGDPTLEDNVVTTDDEKHRSLSPCPRFVDDRNLRGTSGPAISRGVDAKNNGCTYYQDRRSDV
jgi:hypothetical protein